jgi:primosomal protein N' (replication factor Y)
LFVSVAVPVPNLDLLTYAVPDGMTPPAVGARVVVPLGTRIVTGIVVEVGNEKPRTANPETRTPNPAPQTPIVKPIRELLDADAFVPPDVVALAQWTAEYYAAGVGDTIPALLPPMARGGRADAHKTTRVAAITAAGLDALNAKLTDKQRDALELLAGAPTGIATPVLGARGIAADAISRLARHGYISLRQDRVERTPWSSDDNRMGVGSTSDVHPMRVGSTPDADRQLTGEQTAALDRLRKLADTGEFRVALLHGVTGSGKTEIYIRLSAAIRAAGRRVLMLVPEIALTPAAATLFRQAFAERVAIQHSGLSDGERHDQWQRIRRGDVDIVVGTRSAVFAPLERVGLIVVDEEHDTSY